MQLKWIGNDLFLTDSPRTSHGLQVVGSVLFAAKRGGWVGTYYYPDSNSLSRCRHPMDIDSTKRWVAYRAKRYWASIYPESDDDR